MQEIRDVMIKRATDRQRELADLIFKMYFTEDVDFGRVTNLMREMYSEHVKLIKIVTDPNREDITLLIAPEFTTKES